MSNDLVFGADMGTKTVVDEKIKKEFSFMTRSTGSAPDKDLEALKSAAAQQLTGLLSNDDEHSQDIKNQLAKIASLKSVIIPTLDGGQKRYYAFPDQAGGVTEKTCLIDEKTLKNCLQGLSQAQNYADVENHKIRMNAILKHPKTDNLTGARKITEVQREALALKMARILGFEKVTESTIVYHETDKGKEPCLFVPFGKMELMKNYIENSESAQGHIKEPYFNSLEDFGKYSAFFMVCGDPDFIGKEGQNKGISEKKLYLFDQVFMTDQNFALDRSFNLVPTHFLAKVPGISRHFMGRNRSVINDSNFEEKIQGAIHLLEKKDKIQTMFASVMKANSDHQPQAVVKKLQKDAKECLKAFNKRVQNIEKLFPQMKVDGMYQKIGDLIKKNDKEHVNILKKSMLVTQLVNPPKSKARKSHVYRVPFFSNPSTYVKTVNVEKDTVEIIFNRNFGKPLSNDKKQRLLNLGFTVSDNGKSATISKEKLLQLEVKPLNSQTGEVFKNIKKEWQTLNQSCSSDVSAEEKEAGSPKITI